MVLLREFEDITSDIHNAFQQCTTQKGKALILVKMMMTTTSSP
jgi:hypothetical protein